MYVCARVIAGSGSGVVDAGDGVDVWSSWVRSVSLVRSVSWRWEVARTVGDPW